MVKSLCVDAVRIVADLTKDFSAQVVRDVVNLVRLIENMARNLFADVVHLVTIYLCLHHTRPLFRNMHSTLAFRFTLGIAERQCSDQRGHNRPHGTSLAWVSHECGRTVSKTNKKHT
mmetsp:Transcript_1647/g.4522  ORF Transcript_1647/g.4522 Transcript_1647/m.4522 type:complete len:117 (+) Transcript_1647:326-676(+)